MIHRAEKALCLKENLDLIKQIACVCRQSLTVFILKNVVTIRLDKSGFLSLTVRIYLFNKYINNRKIQLAETQSVVAKEARFFKCRHGFRGLGKLVSR